MHRRSSIALIAGMLLALVGAAAPAVAEPTAMLEAQLTSTAVMLPIGDGWEDALGVDIVASDPFEITATVTDAGGDVVAPSVPVPALAASAYGDFRGSVGLTTDTPPVGDLEVHLDVAGHEELDRDLGFRVLADVTPTVTLAVDQTGPLCTWYGQCNTWTGYRLSVDPETPFTGALQFSQGGRVVGSTPVSGTSYLSDLVDFAGLPEGDIQVQFVGTALSHPVSSNAVPVTLTGTHLASVSLSGPSSLYPVTDGFRDTVTFSAGWNAGAVRDHDLMPLSGHLTIARGGRTLLTYMMRTGHTSVTWGGTVAGNRVRAGTYTATLTLAGPDGPALTASRSFVVSSKHLATATSTTWLTGTTALPKHYSYDSRGRGRCVAGAHHAAVCRGYDTARDAYHSTALSAWGERAIPATVVTNEARYGGARVTVRIDVKSTTGTAVWGYETTTNVGYGFRMRTGLTGAGSIPLTTKDTYVLPSIALGADSSATITRVRITYTYRHLVD